jgi:hypothetical protein
MMNPRLLFPLLCLPLALTVLGACSTGTVLAVDDDEQTIPIPVIKGVIFNDDGNPFTMPDIHAPDTEVDLGLCKGFTLTEDDVLEFFRDARRSNRIEFHEFIVSNCRIRGAVILANGKQASFEIDRNRQGWMALDRDTMLMFYCSKCKNAGYDEACDIDCLRADE